MKTSTYLVRSPTSSKSTSQHTEPGRACVFLFKLSLRAHVFSLCRHEDLKGLGLCVACTSKSLVAFVKDIYDQQEQPIEPNSFLLPSFTVQGLSVKMDFTKPITTKFVKDQFSKLFAHVTTSPTDAPTSTPHARLHALKRSCARHASEAGLLAHQIGRTAHT